jgi:HK97 family phage portal protein
MFVSGGSLVTKTPVNYSLGSSYFPHMPPMSTHGWPSAYAGIYSRQLWVNVVVSKRGRATARLPLPVYRHDDLNRPRADDHPMSALLSKPNPAMSGFGLWLWTSSTFDIYGDTFWFKRRKSGRLAGIYPLHPASMSLDEGRWNFDNGTLKLTNIDPGDLVVFRDFHPDSLTRGLSRLEPLRATLENEWSARTATSSFWQRGARPGTALVHPSTLSEPAATRLKRQYDDIGAGANKTGATVVLEEGMKPERMDLTAEEAQYIETRKLNREEVCAAYDVPPPVVHILDRATFSNITEQMRSMYRDTMAPHLKGFEAAIEVDLRQTEWPDDDVYAEFLMDEVLRGDFETRQEALSKADHMTIAEKRKVENLPFIEGTDRIFLNTATQPLDAIDAQARASVAPVPEPDEGDELAPVIPISTARSVLGRLSWQTSLADVDPKTLTDGLSEADRKAVEGAVSAEQRSGGSVAALRDRLRSMGAKMARTKAPDLEDHQGMVTRVLRDYFAAQREAGGSGEEWDRRLTNDLHAAAVLVSRAIGRDAVRDLGFDADVYDVDRTVDFLEAVSARIASNVNTTTAQQLADGGEPDEVFTQAAEVRAPGVATYATAMVAGFAVVEAGRRASEQGAKPRKTWNTGPNPRSSHAAMNGQTVDIDEPFSNGQMWPGEGGDVDEVAGCNCTVEVTV